MGDILRDLSPAYLITAIEANLTSWIPLFGLTGEARFNNPPGVNRAISPVRFSLFNSIMDARLGTDNADPTIEIIKSDAINRQVPILWWIGPSSRPANLGERLLKRGFTIDDDSPGMAVNLESVNEKLPRIEGLSISKVQGDEALQEWARTMSVGFGTPDTVTDPLVGAWTNLLSLVDPDTTQAYLARLDGKPVATSLLRLGAGVAGIYAVATIPGARRKGIGAQVTLQPLLDARHRGYKAGVLGASEMGFGVYYSLGFREYCRIASYKYQPSPT